MPTIRAKDVISKAVFAITQENGRDFSKELPQAASCFMLPGGRSVDDSALQDWCTCLLRKEHQQ